MHPFRHFWDAALRYRLQRVEKALVHLDDPARTSMRTALARAAGLAPFDPAEVGWLERIGSLRQTLASSDQKLMVHGRSRLVSRIARADAISPRAGCLLFSLIRTFQPRFGVEFGTSLGLSAAFQGAAMAMNGCGRLVTIEFEPALATLATHNLASLDLEPDPVSVRRGHFSEVFPDMLAEARASGGVGYAFVDGDHRGDRMMAIYDRLLASAASPAVIVFDDIRYARSMLAAWRRIEAGERIAATLDLLRFGVVLLR